MAEEKPQEEDKVQEARDNNNADLEPELAPKPSWYWIKNSAGEASASLTFATVSFIVCIIWLFISIFESVTIGDTTITTRAFDGGATLALLGTTFSLYFGRRYVDQSAPLKKR